MPPIAALLGLLAVAPAPAPTLLRFHPPVGKVARYVATVSLNASGGAVPQAVRLTQTVPFTLRIVSRKGKTTTLKAKTGRVKVTLPPNSPMAAGKAKMEAAMVGREGTLTVDELGNLQGPGGQTAMAATGGLGKGAQGVAFPAKAVEVGDTWGGTVDLSRLGGAMGQPGGTMRGKIPVTYRLTGLNRGVATIAMNVRGSADLGSGAQAMRIAVRYQGAFDVDAATGLLRRMRATSDNDLTMPGKGTMRQRIVVTMSGS